MLVLLEEVEVTALLDQCRDAAGGGSGCGVGAVEGDQGAIIEYKK